jgi:hypothetical protein
MSVRGGERTDHCASAAAVGVTYWATEFERVYIVTAARIRGKRALIRRCPAGLGDDHKGSQSERSACSLGSRVGADSGGGGAAPSESANRREFPRADCSGGTRAGLPELDLLVRAITNHGARRCVGE